MPGHATRQRFGDWAAEGKAYAAGSFVPRCEFKATLKFFRRAGSSNIDQAGQTIGTVAGTLGPPQNFYLLYIEQGGDTSHSGKVHVVHDKTHGWIRCSLVLGQFSNAAELEIAGPVTVTGKVEVGHQLYEFFKMLDRAIANRVGAQYDQTGRHILNGFWFEIGGDYNFFQGLLG